MKEIRFSKEKDEMLKRTRGIGFEAVIDCIENDKRTQAIAHHNKQKYPKQRVFMVYIKEYIYLIPFIEEQDYIFLKTIYPSRKYTKKLTVKI